MYNELTVQSLDYVTEEDVSRVEIILGRQTKSTGELSVRISDRLPDGHYTSEKVPFKEGILMYQSYGPFKDGQKIIAKGSRQGKITVILPNLRKYTQSIERQIYCNPD